jgi:hypothetical protein
MNKKLLAIVLSTIALTVGAFAFGREPRLTRATNPDAHLVVRQVSQQPQNQAQEATPLQQLQDRPVPKHIVYGIFFREVAAFKKKAQEKESHGQDASFLRNFHKNKLKLNDRQAQALDRIVEEANRETERLDKQAKKIIDDARARHPEGKLNKGEALPAPPAELKDLQQERDKLVLDAREKLRAALGGAEFQLLDDFLQQDVTNKMKPVQPAPGRPETPPSGRPNAVGKLPGEGQ